MNRLKIACKTAVMPLLLCGAITLLFSRVVSGDRPVVLEDGAWDTAQNQPAGPAAGQEILSLRFPAGTVLLVRLLEPAMLRTQGTIDAELASQLSQDGHIAFPKGARVRGHVALTKKQNSPAFASLLLDAIQSIDGKWIEIKTTSVMKKLKGIPKKEPAPPPSTENGGRDSASSFAEMEKSILYPAGRKLAFALTSELVIRR